MLTADNSSDILRAPASVKQMLTLTKLDSLSVLES